MSAAYILLVTWVVFGQPATSYQVPFATEEACTAARLAVQADGARLARESQQRPAGLGPNMLYNPGPPPLLSAVCAKQ
jgi:hypothetical protein